VSVDEELIMSKSTLAREPLFTLHSNLKAEWEELHKARSQLIRDRQALEQEKTIHDANAQQIMAQLKLERDTFEANKLAYVERIREESKELEQQWMELHNLQGAERQPLSSRDRWCGSSTYIDEGWEQDIEDTWVPGLDEDSYDDDGDYKLFNDPFVTAFDSQTSSMRGGGPKPRGQRIGKNLSSAGFGWQNHARSEEMEAAARSAFNDYEKRWVQLFKTPTDPDIPYPTLTGSARDFLKKPAIYSLDVETLPDEAIKDLNIALFFLLAFGISPRLSNDAETPVLEIPSAVSDETIEQLRRQLKKEMTRWHVDKFIHRWKNDTASDSQKDEMDREGKVVFQSISNLFQRCGQELRRRGK
jgi:hypothetical protein